MAGTRSVNEKDKLRMYVSDESSRVLATMEEVFCKEFEICECRPEFLDDGSDLEQSPPHILLYISKSVSPKIEYRIKRLRKEWPKTVLVLLLPSVLDENQVRMSSEIPAHRVVYRPCTKKKIVDVVDNYMSLMRDECQPQIDTPILSSMMEFVGAEDPELYVAYNRVMPLIMGLCQKLDYDWRRVQGVFTLYMVLLANIDRELVAELMSGDGRSVITLRKVYEYIDKMVDMLSMNFVTQQMADDLKYVLKRYDGGGMPDDEVKEQGIPVSARIIRILLDYHYLLQGGKSVGQALFTLNHRSGWYDNVLLHVLMDVLGDEGRQCVREVYPLGLVAGMVIAEDVFGELDGRRTKIITKNEILTDRMVDYLQRHSEDILDITEPIKVVEELFSEEERRNHA